MPARKVSPPTSSAALGPPGRVPPRRRHRTRQRERLLELLRAVDSHPTAQQLHAALQHELPRVALGTVYRNLEVLVSEGCVEEVATANGPTRYDGNLEPHHHFVCERCGAIRDLHLRLPRSLAAGLKRRDGLIAHRVRVEFTGLCPACAGRRARIPRTRSQRPRKEGIESCR